MNYDIFENNDDRKTAIQSLESLEKQDGWTYITRAINANIQKLTDDLKEDDFTDLLEVKLKQKQITHLTELLELPQNIISEAKGQPEPEEDDPY